MLPLFASRRTCPPDKPGVDVVPLLPLDAQVEVQAMVLTYMFTFEGKLDGEQLRTSLYDLIIKKWRILGARLVHNPKVFYYIFPSSFGITST
jgi:hypothetical protein